MNHAVRIGLLLTAALLASPAFANNEDNLCQMNLQKIRDAQATNPNMTAQVKSELDSFINRAQAALERHSDDGARECISLTNQALQKAQSN
ncbi:hypothetical protein [Pseudomonas sp. NA-150]|uniref:hypothetical protein n=1 Tax=Pseudomonas sp. NA-150 TaxID=3367525 RepID=UPI0037CBEE17